MTEETFNAFQALDDLEVLGCTTSDVTGDFNDDGVANVRFLFSLLTIVTRLSMYPPFAHCLLTLSIAGT